VQRDNAAVRSRAGIHGDARGEAGRAIPCWTKCSRLQTPRTLKAYVNYDLALHRAIVKAVHNDDVVRAGLGLNVQGWMSETTVENLKRQQDAFGRDATAKKQLDKSTERLSDRR
jgi:hypothetical protein